jgi:transposase
VHYLGQIRTANRFDPGNTDANASANLYSLIETAKANGIEPYAYLRTVFTGLPQATSVDEIEALLPVANDRDDSARVS